MPAVATKKPGLTPEVQALYDNIKGQLEQHKAHYRTFVEQARKNGDIERWEGICKKLGLVLHADIGRVSYPDGYQPPHHRFDVLYVRHGRTEGNTEPRVFQGAVDEEQNQLIDVGEKQAIEAADKMDVLHKTREWVPDVIVFSPFGRAMKTGEAYSTRHPDIPVHIINEAGEMQFGNWDNRMVKDLPEDHMGHLFYLEQNALVKAEGPYKCPVSGKVVPAENYVEVLDRQAKLLEMIDELPEVKRAEAEGRRAKVNIYGHSMSGSAVMVLLGHGKITDDEAGRTHGAVGFDGKYIMPNATPTQLIARKVRLVRDETGSFQMQSEEKQEASR